MVYAAANRSLAMVEVVVHTPPGTTPPNYVLVTIGFPDDLPMTKLDEKSLPKKWYEDYSVTQQLGDDFIEAGEYCIMSVPSAVTPGDTNLLLNPDHKDFARVEIIAVEDFSFDRRLLR